MWLRGKVTGKLDRLFVSFLLLFVVQITFSDDRSMWVTSTVVVGKAFGGSVFRHQQGAAARVAFPQTPNCYRYIRYTCSEYFFSSPPSASFSF